MKLTQDALDLAIPQDAGEYDYDGDGKPGGPRPASVDNIAFLMKPYTAEKLLTTLHKVLIAA